MTSIADIRTAAEGDLVTFIKLVAPQTLLGGLHTELAAWWTRQEAKPLQLCLLPRDHQKSRMVAYRVAWYLTNHPDHRILYISATSNLAEKQLKFIKDILTSKIYRRYWPEMVHLEEGKREKWTNSEVSLDHPLRAKEGVRDPSIFTAGLTTSITGLHCDVAVLDDVVVPENAYTNEGREKVKSQYSLLSSIEGADAQEWVVGTRYHSKDLYNDLMEMAAEVYTDEGEVIDYEPLYEKFERQVEDEGSGIGEFCWPRQQRSDGKWFGFDKRILAQKRGKYLDRGQFYAQYYNNPNNPDGKGISIRNFQYYDKKYLTREGGVWYHKGTRLNVFAAIDFAFSLSRRADHTAIVVIGADANGNYYVLDIERFKTDRIKDYYEAILRMHIKWDFRKIRAEITAAQKAIVTELKSSYIKPNGLALSIDEHSPTRHTGSKEERLRAVLEPRYDNLSIWHYEGGNCQVLEDELTQDNPPHDDVKDALACAIEIAVPPSSMARRGKTSTNVLIHPRFGGVASRYG
jgi:phage terminase large subunit-like protein